MATILIIQDRPVDRKFLSAILQTQGHQIVEAADGQEALATLADVRPDVVISDILSPTVDGSEFVRRMRETPAHAATPVIFYAAAYHEPEARALAHQCGVTDILTNPSAPQVIVATLNTALHSNARPLAARRYHATSNRKNLHLVSSPPVAPIDRVEAERQRMTAVLEVAEEIAAQHDPVAVIDKVCTEARRVTLARHAIAGLLSEEGSTRERFHTSGLDAANSSIKPTPTGGALAAVVREVRPVRARNPEGRPETLGLPTDYPKVSSLLSVPIASSSRVYGWLSLQNKLGVEEFTDVDERVAVTFGTHAGIAYEKAQVADKLRRRATALEREVHRTSARVREEERSELSRTLHDQMGQTLAGLKIDVNWLAAQLPASGPSRSAVTDKLDSILERLDETIESVRTIARGLRPDILERLGLVAALQWQATDFERRSGIRCRVDSRPGEIEMEPRRSAGVFKIVKEALTNVLQHAHATRVTVSIRWSSSSLTVSVVDNGRGISDRHLANVGSLGLTGMRERSSLLGGTFDVRRRRPHGTVVTCTIPLAHKQRKRRPRS